MPTTAGTRVAVIDLI